MADPILHIKDSYYFEVPKLLYPYEYRSRRQFPDVWISLDPEYQEWEADRLYDELARRDAELPGKETTLHDWHQWLHADHANFAKPLKEFLQEKHDAQYTKFQAWKTAELTAAQKDKSKSVEDARRLDFNDYLKHAETTDAADKEYFKFYGWLNKNQAAFERAKSEARNVKEWKEDRDLPEWSKEKLAAYNGHLSGKILIPQPFGTLRNFYEPETTIINDASRWSQVGVINWQNFGLCISKYMVIELVVCLILVLLFSQLAKHVEAGKQAKGKLWNLLEVFLVFIRDQIAKPSLGGHHEEDLKHPEEGHPFGDPYAEHGKATDEHGHLRAEQKAHAAAAHGHDHHVDQATRFAPLLWTIFFFVLGCNLMGLVPWAGSPTAAWAVTFALAMVTFATVWAAGMLQFGFLGFFLNQVPSMDLPWYMAIVLKPMIFLIEMLGLCIKHAVLSVRLLANMVAGHLVILGVMGLAFGAEAALYYTAPTTPGWQWWLTATIAVVGAAAFNILELFVAFLQAYIFTFLTALFIGAAIHKH